MGHNIYRHISYIACNYNNVEILWCMFNLDIHVQSLLNECLALYSGREVCLSTILCCYFC